MAKFSAVCVFCEDIREEKSGQDTIVGTLPDNIQIVSVPPALDAKGLLPKLGIYVRINLDVNDKPKDVSAKVLTTTGDIVTQHGWDRAVIDKAFKDSEENKMPLVGLILKVVIGPFPIARSGKITALVTLDGVEYLAGALNIIVPSPNASPPPV